MEWQNIGIIKLYSLVTFSLETHRSLKTWAKPCNNNSCQNCGIRKLTRMSVTFAKIQRHPKRRTQDSKVFKEGLFFFFLSLFYHRITESISSFVRNGTILALHIVNTLMIPQTLTPPCWTPFGNLICSLPMKRVPTFMKSLQTINC